MNKTNCRIALADDDADDRALFEQAMKQVKKDIELTMFNDGHDLMESLLQQDAIMPDMIFLDLKMPRIGGIESLEEIRSHEPGALEPYTVLMIN